MITGPWTSVEAVKSCCGNLALDEIDTRIQEAVDVASELVYWLSGKPWSGVQEITTRPHDESLCMGRSATSPVDWPDPIPALCGCARRGQVDLGRFPITEVLQVLIDGDDVDPSTYEVRNGRVLQRLAGPGPQYLNDGWPRHQHLDRATTEPGTFSVRFRYGTPIPFSGQQAAKALACELVKACAGSPDCQLPGRVTTLNRQGVSMTLIDPSALAEGKTGVYETDLFLAAVNPNKVRGGALVWSPDLVSAPGE